MLDRISIKTLLEKINPNLVVITPNQRLSATLNKLYHAFQVNKGMSAWQTPSIMPVQSWIKNLWDTHAFQTNDTQAIVLNNRQITYLFESIIAKNQQENTLLQLQETAKTAKSAYDLVERWHISLDHPDFNSTEDYHTFSNWANTFKQRCETNHWITPASLPTMIRQRIESNHLSLPSAIYLVGFSEHDPDIAKLFQACKSANTQIESIDLCLDRSNPESIALANFESEIMAIAAWARACHEKDKSARIGCVIPTLEQSRDRVWQLFSEAFASEDSFTTSPDAMPFNISAGKRLSQYPLISTALKLLQLTSTVSLESLLPLLHSPHLGESEVEFFGRARLDATLREDNTDSLSIIDHPLIMELSPHLSTRLKRFIEYRDTLSSHHTYSAWATHFSQLLQIAGWPGERDITSDEYQIIHHWVSLLHELTTLDIVASPAGYEHALKQVIQLANETTFQAKTPEAPIQILGLLEAASIPFDHLWVSGMSDLTWPPQPSPNPFIPKTLQREHHMPHATAERELLYCQTLTKQFIGSADHPIFSYARQIDNIEASISPLLRTLPSSPTKEIHTMPFSSATTKVFLSKSLEYLQDNTAPALPTDEIVRGGTQIIKYQAMCPFKAFAEIRLNAQALSHSYLGISAADRGSLLHHCLQLVWEEIKHHQTLITLDENQLTSIIDSSIAKSMTRISHSSPTLIRLETQRLRQLLTDWLAIEKERPDFTVIAHEKQSTITVNNLSFTVRVDRIDDIGFGKKMVIDYKTGRYLSLTDAIDERPTEPQLGLYALLDADHTVGVSFAKLLPGNSKFSGISGTETHIKGISHVEDWSQQLTQWKISFDSLSKEFSEGCATVNPKNGQTTCQFCRLQPLCRVHEEVTV